MSLWPESPAPKFKEGDRVRAANWSDSGMRAVEALAAIFADGPNGEYLRQQAALAREKNTFDTNTVYTIDFDDGSELELLERDGAFPTRWFILA